MMSPIDPVQRQRNVESVALAHIIERERISLADLIAELTLPEMDAPRRAERAEEVRAAVAGLGDAGLMERNEEEDLLSPTRPARRAGELELGL
jgi:hypothetical protein